MQLAQLCAMFANAHRDPKVAAFKAEDFLLRFETVEEERRRKTQAMFDTLRAIAKPGKPKRKKGAKGRT